MTVAIGLVAGQGYNPYSKNKRTEETDTDEADSRSEREK